MNTAILIRRAENRWPLNRWIKLILLIFAAHLILIYLFGEWHRPAPRAVAHVPNWQLAADDEWMALNNPTLFSLPHERDFAASVWMRPPTVRPPSFRWTESPRWLPLRMNDLGATFLQFVRTNAFSDFQLDLKPAAPFSQPIISLPPALPQNSRVELAGSLAGRQWLNAVNPPSFPFDDVITPSRVQVLVAADGRVISAILLPLSEPDESAARNSTADAQAVEMARAARFTPATRLVVGQMIFHWHTIPVTATNAPGNL